MRGSCGDPSVVCLAQSLAGREGKGVLQRPLHGLSSPVLGWEGGQGGPAETLGWDGGLPDTHPLQWPGEVLVCSGVVPGEAGPGHLGRASFAIEKRAQRGFKDLTPGKIN